MLIASLWVLPAALALEPGPSAALCAEQEQAVAALERQSSCHTVTLGQAWEQAVSTEQRACLAKTLSEHGISTAPMVRPGSVSYLGQPEPDTGEGDTGADAQKDVLSTYDAPYTLESENFVVHWGTENEHFDGYSDTYSRMEELLQSFEDSYAHLVGLMGMADIPFMQAYKFNVYLGNTGDELPSSSGAAGYFTGDSSGNPMIMIAESTAANSVGYMQSVIAHEFFHALQWATGSYSYSGVSAWYWEATACWASKQVYPEEGAYAVFLYAFANYQFYPLNYFDYPDSGLTTELHQYGAFIFPQYISEVAADWEIIRNSWTATSGQPDPLKVIDTYLEARGLDVVDEWARFIAHNATWDYEDNATYEYYIEAYDWIGDGEETQWGDYGDGQAVMTDPPGELPRGKGSNLLYLKYPQEGDVVIEFQGEPAGSDGSAVDWRLTLAIESGNDIQYETLPVTDNYGFHTIENGHFYDAIYLAIGAWSDDASADETFSYTWRFGVEQDDSGADTGEEAVAEKNGLCGCASTVSPLSISWMLPLLGACCLRRRFGVQFQD